MGSTTVKAVILNEKEELLFSSYERHFADILKTLTVVLKQAYEQFKDYKNIPTGFCKYVDKLNSSNNRTYKPVKIANEELTYIEQRKEV